MQKNLPWGHLPGHLPWGQVPGSNNRAPMAARYLSPGRGGLEVVHDVECLAGGGDG